MNKNKIKNKKVKINYKNDFNFKTGELFHRMDFLLKLGSELYPNLPNLAKMYGGMIKDIAKRNALRIESSMKKLICQKCNNFLFLDKNTFIDLKSI